MRSDYPTTEISLPPDAVLAFYTDGLVEIPGTDIDDTSVDLADTLLRYCRGCSPCNDDIALLLVRATSP
ncbi:SpoIIE family protein phosphatase [Streptomyces sp. NPDC002574]|uniref:SpoIIE family protein phosphatase n=1 Tax=Streptomyces sp. NPDC002574 TaxID=3364652 RepID=UPI0036A7CA69